LHKRGLYGALDARALSIFFVLIQPHTSQ